MLSVNSYPKDYIDACRARLDEQIAAYDALVMAAKGDGAVDRFEALYFNSLVLVLDRYFLHRSRIMEGKDGNPANEVRLLCDAITLHDDKLPPDKQIKLKPETSVLKLQTGEVVKISRDGFVALAAAFFNEIEQKYP